LGIGDFVGHGNDDVLWLDKSTGEVGAWLISNGAVTGWAPFGPVDVTQWQFAGIGKFEGPSCPADVLWFNYSNGNVVAWIIQNAAVTSGPVLGSGAPSQWQLVGVGNFEGNGTDDILWENQSTALVGAWVITAGSNYSAPTVTGWEGLGYATSGWALVASGDLGNGTADVLWENNSTGVVEAWIISNGAVASTPTLSTASPPSQWQILGAGNLTGQTSGGDVLLRNLSSGMVDSWIIQADAYQSTSVLGPA
jgi:hypothetical protein